MHRQSALPCALVDQRASRIDRLQNTSPHTDEFQLRGTPPPWDNAKSRNFCRKSWQKALQKFKCQKFKCHSSMCPTVVSEGAVESCPRLNGRMQLRKFVLRSLFGITRFIPYHQLRCERFYGNTAIFSCFQFKARLG